MIHSTFQNVRPAVSDSDVHSSLSNPLHIMKPGARAREPTPPACEFSSTACSLSHTLFLRYQSDHFFLFPRRTRQAGGAGGNHVPGAQFQELRFLSLTAPSSDAEEQSTAASAEPFCFHSQRMTLSSFPCSNSITTRSTFLQGQIRNPLIFATALFTVVAHVLQRLAFEWLALRVLW